MNNASNNEAAAVMRLTSAVANAIAQFQQQQPSTHPSSSASNPATTTQSDQSTYSMSIANTSRLAGKFSVHTHDE